MERQRGEVVTTFLAVVAGVLIAAFGLYRVGNAIEQACIDQGGDWGLAVDVGLSGPGYGCQLGALIIGPSPIERPSE